MRYLLVTLLAACGTSGSARKQAEEGRPDAAALARETTVRAQTARLVLSDYFRKEAVLKAAATSDKGAGIRIARGNVVFTLRGLRIEAAQSLEIRWQADAEHDTILLDAKQVRLFHQKRKRPYLIENASAVVMANDQISFFQQ